MSTFVYRAIVPCYVEYTFTVEAESREDADEKFYNSPPDPQVGLMVSKFQLTPTRVGVLFGVTSFYAGVVVNNLGLAI